MATQRTPQNLADSTSTDSSLQDISPPSSDHEHHLHNTAHIDRERNTLTLYSPPTALGLIRGAAINLVLPFINGLMLGFGELFAHELAFRFGWSGTRIFPLHRSSQTSARPAVPGVEIREDRGTTRRREQELDKLTSLE